MKTSRASTRTAFTLIEMLVVIVIIGILMAFLLPALNSARLKALNVKMTTEVNQLSNSVEEYKMATTDYPVDFSDRNLVNRHILTAFPQTDAAEQARVNAVFWVNPGAAPGDADYHASNVDPAEALVFWLGGFSSDVRRPFTGVGGPFLTNNAGVIIGINPDRNQSTFTFQKDRFENYDGDLFPVYPPEGRTAPYVYFDHRTYGGLGMPDTAPVNGFYPLAATSSFGWARPYLSTTTRASSPYGVEWCNQRTFQIICAGLDDNYGGQASFLAAPATLRPYPVFPTGVNYTSPGIGDDDNITNFSRGKLGDQKP